MDETIQNDYPALKAHYKFTKDDEALLIQMKPQIESLTDDFIRGVLRVYYEFWQNRRFP